MSGPLGWSPTHRVCVGGTPGWPSPDGSGPPVARLDSEAHVRVVEVRGGWSRAQSPDGRSSWVDTRALSIIPPGGAWPQTGGAVSPGEELVTRSLLETWRAPDRAAPSGPEVGAGVRVQVADVQRGWARITFANGLEAWAEVEQLGLAAGADRSRPVTPGRAPAAPPPPLAPAAQPAPPPVGPHDAVPAGGGYGQPGIRAYAPSGMPPYAHPGMPVYGPPGMPVYGPPGMPAYGQPGFAPFAAPAGAARGPQAVRRAIPVISAVVVIVGALVPWFRVEGLSSSNAFDIPIAFLFSGPGSAADSPKIVGVLLIVLAAAGAAAAQLPMLSALCRLCGVAVIGASVAYVVQIQRSLVGDGAPSLGSVIGAGVFIAGVGGLGLLVTPPVRRTRGSMPAMLRPPGAW